MKIFKDIEQNTPEWHEFRRSGIGASEIAAVMGVCPYKTASDIYKLKTEEPQEDVRNFWMQRGVDSEPEARRFFEHLQNDRPYPPLTIQHDDFSYFKASLDGYCEQDDSIVEIKVPGSKVLKMAEEGRIPIHYLYQIQWQLMVSRCRWAFYFVYHPETMEYYQIKVMPDKKLFEEMKVAAHAFWNLVKARKCPIDKKTAKLVHEKNSRILNQMYEIKQKIQLLDLAYDTLKNTLLEEEGEDISLENDSLTFYKAERSGYDYKKAATDAKIDLEQYKKPTTISWTIKQKKEKS